MKEGEFLGGTTKWMIYRKIGIEYLYGPFQVLFQHLWHRARRRRKKEWGGKNVLNSETFRDRRGMRGARGSGAARASVPAAAWQGRPCSCRHGACTTSGGILQGPEPLLWKERKMHLRDAHALPVWRVIMMLQGWRAQTKTRSLRVGGGGGRSAFYKVGKVNQGCCQAVVFKPGCMMSSQG